MNNFDKIINNVLGKNKQVKGASIKKQMQWKSFGAMKRNKLRARFKDSDGDRIPNKWDCSPFNVMKQDFAKGLKCVDCGKELKNSYISSDEGSMCDKCFQKKAASGYWTKKYPTTQCADCGKPLPKNTNGALCKDCGEAFDIANEQEELAEKRVMESNRAFANEIDSIRDNEQVNRTFSTKQFESPKIPDKSLFKDKDNFDKISGLFKPKKKTYTITDYREYKS